MRVVCAVSPKELLTPSRPLRTHPRTLAFRIRGHKTVLFHSRVSVTQAEHCLKKNMWATEWTKGREREGRGEEGGREGERKSTGERIRVKFRERVKEKEG